MTTTNARTAIRREAEYNGWTTETPNAFEDVHTAADGEYVHVYYSTRDYVTMANTATKRIHGQYKAERDISHLQRPTDRVTTEAEPAEAAEELAPAPAEGGPLGGSRITEVVASHLYNLAAPRLGYVRSWAEAHADTRAEYMRRASDARTAVGVALVSAG